MKYDDKAERWTEKAYADADAYLAHRAELILSLGPKLAPGDTVLDLACGDGGLAAHLPGSALHAESTRAPPWSKRRGGAAATSSSADLNEYEPPEAVTATTCFRAIYYARDRADFFRRVAGYTERKLVFDLNPRQYRVDEVRADLRAAGFDRAGVAPVLLAAARVAPRARRLDAARRSSAAGRWPALLLALPLQLLVRGFPRRQVGVRDLRAEVAAVAHPAGTSASPSPPRESAHRERGARGA